MKPSSFTYLRPQNLNEALQLLTEHGEDAKILSGGQSLIPVLNMRLSTPKYIIDFGRITDLNYIREEDGQIVIGALTRHAQVEKSELVKSGCSLLSEAMKYVGHAQIRNRGTMGGSVAHADPSAEIPCVLSALRGEIVITSEDEEVTVNPAEFFLTYLLTSLEPNQMIKEVRFPSLSPTCGTAFLEVSRRHGDFALVEVAAVIDLDEEGNISLARIAVGGAGPIPCVLEEVEEFLVGQSPTDELLKEAGKRAMDFLDPESDLHGTAEYRRHLASVMTERALKLAVKRAKGEDSV